MNLTFRPAVETLDARDLPAVTLADAWVTSVQPATEPAAVVFVAPTGDDAVARPTYGGYDLKTARRV